MGGLLDKANATSQEETTAEPVKTAEKKAEQTKSDSSSIVRRCTIIKNLLLS